MSPDNAAYTMQAAEYFIDSDPGEGNATPIAGNYGGDEASIDIDVPTDDLDFGVHWVFFRFQDNQGVWSAPKGSSFTVINPEVESYTVTSAEYFIDSDPGEGNGIAMDAVDGTFDSDLERMQRERGDMMGQQSGPGGQRPPIGQGPGMMR